MARKEERKIEKDRDAERERETDREGEIPSVAQGLGSRERKTPEGIRILGHRTVVIPVQLVILFRTSRSDEEPNE